jgi:hypothetical protein
MQSMIFLHAFRKGERMKRAREAGRSTGEALVRVCV